MNSDATIEDRMFKAGLPYEITNMESPQFLFSGGSSVVAIWKDSKNDNTRTFVGYYHKDQSAPVIEKAGKVRGVFAVYFVNPKLVN